jgi:hypothetical protein
MTSLGPWTAEEVAEHFARDYGEDDGRWPFTRRSVLEFMRAAETLVLTAC